MWSHSIGKDPRVAHRIEGTVGNRGPWSWNLAIVCARKATPLPAAWSGQPPWAPFASYPVLPLPLRIGLFWFGGLQAHCCFHPPVIREASRACSLLHPQQRHSDLPSGSPVPVHGSVTEAQAMGCSVHAGCSVLTRGRAWVFQSGFLGCVLSCCAAVLKLLNLPVPCAFVFWSLKSG